MAIQTSILLTPTFVLPLPFYPRALTSGSCPKPNSYKPLFFKPPNVKLYCSNSKINSFNDFIPQNPSLSIIAKIYTTVHNESTRPGRIRRVISPLHNLSTRPVLTGSTRPVPSGSIRRPVATLLAIAILISKLFGKAIANFTQGVCKNPSPNQLLTIQGMQGNLINTTGPLFFAAIGRYQRPLQTPLTVVASGMVKCIEFYMAALAIRCALAYFPNIEWNSQPYLALREFCDPYLLFFRDIVPPISNTLDISGTVGFMVLGTLIEILNATSMW